MNATKTYQVSLFIKEYEETAGGIKTEKEIYLRCENIDFHDIRDVAEMFSDLVESAHDIATAIKQPVYVRVNRLSSVLTDRMYATVDPNEWGE